MNTNNQFGTKGRVKLTINQRIVKGTFSDDHHSVFSFDDDDVRGKYAFKDEPNFENPFSPTNASVFETEKAAIKNERNLAEYMNFEQQTDAQMNQN